MREIDLHHMTVDEALKFFILCCQDEWRKGRRAIKVIHGYGSSGSRGKIKESIRNFVKNSPEYFNYETGEGIDMNQGYTVVILKKIVDGFENVVESQILNFCGIPKSIDKITGEFRKHGEKEIASAVNKLVKKGVLKEVIKGKLKCYVTA